MLSLTERATATIEQILEDSKAGPESGLRISSSTEPSGDTSLQIELAAEPILGDAVVREGGATVFLDDVAATALEGQTLDVEAHGDHYHFSLGEPGSPAA